MNIHNRRCALTPSYAIAKNGLMVCFNIQDRQESDIHIANLKTDDQLLT